jgi:hypothetical protein
MSEEQHRLLQEATDMMNSAYVRLVQLGNNPIFSEVRGELGNLVEKLEGVQ